MSGFRRFHGAPLALAAALPLLPVQKSARLLSSSPPPTTYLSPTALAATKDGGIIFVACANGNRIFRFDLARQCLLDSVSLPDSPSGLALSADDARLFVTCAAPESKICVLIAGKGKVVATLPGGHTAVAPVLSPDGKALYVCNRFNNDVSMFDLATRKEVRRIALEREPVAADLTKDGRFLLVANHLHTGRADVEDVAAVVSVIDVAAGKVVKELRLPTGSGVLNDLRVSPDGRYAAVTHLVAGFNRAASQVQSGWMNANALTLIDLDGIEVHSTVLLDEPKRGAANPWGVSWSADSSTLVVTHAGTHEVSVIDFPALLAGIQEAQRTRLPRQGAGLHNGPATKAAKPVLVFLSRYEGLAEGLPFLVGARRRVKLPEGDLGPRAVVVLGHTAYTANYFSDTLTAIDLSSTNSRPESIPLDKSALRTPHSALDPVRKGDFYFHDASICFQGWQSCSSCHPGDARVDGLNWDLLNDGIGNPKNTKSLLLAHQTPPAMWLGVRDTAEMAVRAGIKHILFTEQPEEVASAIDAYLKSLEPVPSPHLVDGQLSEAAERGQKVFARAGCAVCHPPPLFTDLREHDVGTRRGFDRPGDKFHTPTLVEVWRTAPYLHDGSAATVRDVLTIRNAHDQHGKTSNLTTEEVGDLCAYLLSL